MDRRQDGSGKDRRAPLRHEEARIDCKETLRLLEIDKRIAAVITSVLPEAMHVYSTCAIYI